MAVSAEIDARGDAWLRSEELAAMWAGHVHDVDGFVHGDHAYRIGHTGRFERVLVSANGETP